MQLFPSPDETIVGTQAAQRAGRTTCVALVESCLRKIDALEERTRAWVSVDREGAMARARQLDDDLRQGVWRGPLHGVPIGIKDLIDVEGWPTAAGFLPLASRVAERDAPLVARLREAGAIILGKTVTTQFACFDPPVTRNPWNPDRTPGGSSSGSAAAVATGMCLAAIGSQTGGSITRPASYCGVAGCKATFGAIPMEGVFPVALSLDHPGPIARSVADLAILFAVLAGTPPIDCAAASPPRLGRLCGIFGEKLPPEARKLHEQALGLLANAGASVSDAPLPSSFDEVLPLHRRIMVYELGQVHRDRFAEHPTEYLPGIRGLIEQAREIPRREYDRAREHQERLRAEMTAAFEGFDVLVCPATVGPAPDPSTTGDPSFNSPWSYTGLPTVSFPIGLAPDGLPLSIQLVGRHGDEPNLFRAAAWCEGRIRR